MYALTRFSTVLLVSLLSGLSMPAQAARSLHYAGTVGEQQVTLLLELAGDRVSGGSYRYKTQKSEVHIVDSRQFGTTVVLQDEDGNILHLHFETAAGEKTGGFDTAELLEGTLDRGELDLPVKLKRGDASTEAGTPQAGSRAQTITELR